MEPILFLLGLVLLDLAALRWGRDSRDSLDHEEWTRRRAWPRAIARAPRRVARPRASAPAIRPVLPSASLPLPLAPRSLDGACPSTGSPPTRATAR